MRKQDHKLTIKYIWSYVAIILVTFTVILSIIFINTNRFFSDTLLDFSQNQLEECMHLFENVVQESRQITVRASLDNALAREYALSSRVNEYQVIQRLEEYQLLSSNFNNILLYYQGTDDLFDCSAKYTIGNLPQQEDWEFLNEDPQSPLPGFHPIHTGQNLILPESNGVAIAYALPYNSSQPFAVLCCVMENEKIEDMFASLEEEYSISLFIRGADGDIFYSKDVHGIQDPSALFEAGEDVYDSEGRKLVAVHSKSAGTGISAVLLVDENEYFSPIYSMTLLLLFIALVCLLAMVMLSIHISRKNIGPIVKLREYILMNHIADPDEALPELFEKVKSMYSSSQLMAEQLQMRKRMLLNDTLSRVAFGYFSPGLKRERKNLQELNVDFDCRAFTGCCVRIRSQGQMADKTALLVEDFAARNQAENRIFPVAMQENDRFAVLILSDDPEGSDVKDTADALQQYLQKDDVYVSISIGQTVEHLEEAYLSVAAACSLADSSMASIHVDGGSAVSWPYILKNQIIINQLVRMNKGEEAVALMKNLLDEISARGTGNKLAVCINVILSATEMDKNLPETDELPRLINNLLSSVTIAQVKKYGEETLLYLSRQINEQNQSQELKLFNDMVRYIQENYDNNQISLEYISEKFNISVYYISKFFKNVSGCNFNQYLTRLRMEKARSLLATTMKPLREITVEVGYVDESSFSRKFKNIYGETPGQYRKRERG